MTKFTAHDRHFMAYAIALSRRSLGNCAENPAVGCVLVAKGGEVPLACGWTASGGRPHAEPQALQMAGDKAKGATAYVTLEPCSHHGKTGPCCEALINAGIARVVVACSDPDPRVNGTGIARLQQAGIVVEQGLLADRAGRVLAGFFSRITRNRPLVTLKQALSVDGKIAAKKGQQTAITGVAANKKVHLMRAQTDAIMVGIGTVLADDPQLTCRLAGYENRSPVRVVCDSQLRLPLSAKMLKTAHQIPVIILTTSDDQLKIAALKAKGAEVMHCNGDANGTVDLADALQKLAQRGLNNLLVEAGAKLAASLIKAALVDRLAWFKSRNSLGAQGLAAVEGLVLDDIVSGQDFQLRYKQTFDSDELSIYDHVGECFT